MSSPSRANGLSWASTPHQMSSSCAQNCWRGSHLAQPTRCLALRFLHASRARICIATKTGSVHIVNRRKAPRPGSCQINQDDRPRVVCMVGQRAMRPAAVCMMTRLRQRRRCRIRIRATADRLRQVYKRLLPAGDYLSGGQSFTAEVSLHGKPRHVVIGGAVTADPEAAIVPQCQSKRDTL